MIKTLPAAALAIAGLASVLPATPAAASGGGPRPITTWVRAVEAHEPTWVDVYWRTGRKICDARVEVGGRRVDVGYPSNTGTYTSFSRSDMLKPGRIDRTAVKVTAHHRKSAFVPIEATIRYNTSTSGTEKSRTFRLTLPVLVR